MKDRKLMERKRDLRKIPYQEMQSRAEPRDLEFKETPTLFQLG